MKEKLKKFLLIILFLNFPFNAFSTEIIVYLDIDFVFKNTDLGKKIILRLDEENKKNINKFKAKENELKKTEKDLINKKKILSKNEFDNQLTNFTSNVKLFKKNRDQIINNFEKNKNEEIKKYFNKINPLLKQYMSDNSIKIIIDKKNILLASDTLDITESIIDMINQKLD